MAQGNTYKTQQWLIFSEQYSYLFVRLCGGYCTMYILYITLNYIQCYSLQLSCVQLAYDDVMYLHVAMAWSTPSPGRLWGILQQHIPISALLSMHWTVPCLARAPCSMFMHAAFCSCQIKFPILGQDFYSIPFVRWVISPINSPLPLGLSSLFISALSP